MRKGSKKGGERFVDARVSRNDVCVILEPFTLSPTIGGIGDDITVLSGHAACQACLRWGNRWLRWA
jgi:hypothetical protein